MDDSKRICARRLTWQTIDLTYSSSCSSDNRCKVLSANVHENEGSARESLLPYKTN
jgi:hypothetical protein